LEACVSNIYVGRPDRANFRLWSECLLREDFGAKTEVSKILGSLCHRMSVVLIGAKHDFGFELGYCFHKKDLATLVTTRLIIIEPS
jgi:hypothetical protein